jgi:hypothetical protein
LVLAQEVASQVARSSPAWDGGGRRVQDRRQGDGCGQRDQRNHAVGVGMDEHGNSLPSADYFS